jgi:membrane-associated protease RseP (regulator of RpoE activity)
MEKSVVRDPEEAHYTRMRVLKILGLILALCLACGLGTLFGGGLVFGVMKISESSPSAAVQAPFPLEQDLKRVIPASGAVIVEVMPGSPAEDAGLKEGDIVVAVDGQGIGAERGLADAVAEYEPGDRIRLDVQRPGEGGIELRVRLGENPDNAGAAYLGVRYSAALSPMAPGSEIQPFEMPEEWDPGQMPFAVPGTQVERGVVIQSIEEDSPASAAGLNPGDLITAFDGKPLDGPEALVEMVAGYEAGDRVALTVIAADGSGEREVMVTLGEHPEDPERAYLGVFIGGYMERRRFEGGSLPEGFQFRGQPFFFGAPGDQMPPGWDQLPFDWHSLPFDPGELPFDWHQLEPDRDAVGSSA